MSIKRFVGLGYIGGSTVGIKTSAPVYTTRPSQPLIGHTVVHHASPSPHVGSLPPRPPAYVVPPPPSIKLPGKVESIKFQRPQENLQPIATFKPVAEPQVLSVESAAAPYETIFQDFNLEAIPFYNYWLPDEGINDKEPRGNRKLEDCPRFIKVVWNPAPEMPRAFFDEPNATNPAFRNIRPIKFGLEIEQPQVFKVKGINFLPEHLQPHNFSVVRKSLANGYIGPGMVDGVVEMPIQNVSTVSHEIQFRTSHLHQIDEDAFLVSPRMRGVSFHELKANVHQLTNGVVGATAIGAGRLSTSAQKDSDTFFNGKFAVNMTPFGGGNLQIHSVHPSSPSLSMVARVAQPRGGEPYDQVVDMVREVVGAPNSTDVPRSLQTKVKFVHPAIDGAVQQDRVNLMTRPEHAESMIAIAHALPHLEMFSRAGVIEEKRKIEIPSFPAPAGIKPVEYVGYVLEKYKRTSAGVFVKEEEIELASRDYTEYYDTKIRYGEVYRYRIRAIVRWTRPQNVGPFGPEPLTVAKPGTSSKGIAPYKSSYFAGEWNQNWAYASVLDTMPPPPPDELTVRPESSRNRICVTFRVPENSQKDIYQMVLFRKLQDESGRDLTSWIQVRDDSDRPVTFDLKNVLFYDNDVQYYQDLAIRYVYAAVCLTRHGEISTLSDQLGARLSREWKTKGEFPVDFVSCAGVKFQHVGAFSTYPFRRMRSEIVVAPETSMGTARLMFSGRNAFGNGTMTDALYFVRVESLDTGEKIDIPLNVKYRTLKDRIDTTVNWSVAQRGEQKVREAEQRKQKEIEDRKKNASSKMAR